MPQPGKIDRGGIVDHRNGNGGFRPPQDRGGRPITERPWQNRNGRVIPPSRDHIREIDRREWHDNIRREQGRWDRNDHGYRWYDWNGRRVCGHYDTFGYFWWGFYLGDVYFWTRYYNDYYWWYDPYWHRWCYQRDGRWWWRDPASVDVVYVYENDSYYRYSDTTGGVVLQPDPTPPTDTPPASEEPAPVLDQKTFTSEDGTRSVTVTTDDKQSAFLNDTAETPAFQPIWLGDGVTDVRFKNNADGSLNEILTITNDGSFGIFDKDGYAINASEIAPVAGIGDDAPESPSVVGSSLQKSESFGALTTGSVNW